MDAILDAAAAIIRESGLVGLTVHGTAQRAGTSIGSMYHFFPNLDSVIAGLIDRHLRRLEPLLFELAAREPVAWARMSAAAVADALITPIFSYSLHHPDMLVVSASPVSAARFGNRIEAMKSAALDIIERIFAARCPAVRPQVRRARAAVMVGTMDGVAALLTRAKTSRPLVVQELRRAVTAHLTA